MSRREFTRAVAVEIAKRALRPDGQMACEKCGAIGGKLELHHLTLDAMETDKSRKLTSADGALWCRQCHDVETKAQAPILAQARAREASALNVRTGPVAKIKSAGFAKSARTLNRQPKPPANGLPAIARQFRSAT
jgi:hypothetical protein